MKETERWLQRAEALREAVRADAAVVELDAAARYETRGRGAPVRGLRLRKTGAGASAHVGVVLDEAALRERSVREVVQRLRTALRERWATLGQDRELKTHELEVHVDVVDLASPPAAERVT